MKKIFTLIISLGFLVTSAWAQSEHRQKNQDKSYKQSPSLVRGHEMKNGSNTYSYEKNSQWDKKNSREDQYAYNRNNRSNDHRDRDEHFYPKYESKRKNRDRDIQYQPVRLPLLQIILSIGGR
jgi:hypothetical protein